MPADYKGSVQPYKFEGVFEGLAEKMPSRYPESICVLAGLHEYLQSAADYRKTGSRIASPDNMIDRLTGDCQDQSVLLASLYLASGADTRFVCVESKSGGGHVLVQVSAASIPEKIGHIMAGFYKDYVGKSIGDVYWESDNGSCWLIADPVMSSYVGDLSGLDSSGLLESKSKSGWSWYNKYRTIHL